MVPWATAVAQSSKFGEASFFDIEYIDLPAFILPLYGRSFPDAYAHAGQIAWFFATVLWVWLASKHHRSMGNLSGKLQQAPYHVTRMEGMLVRGFKSSGPYANLNLSISLYLLLTTSCVFLSGLYTVSHVRFRNSKSLFGALQKGPETFDCLLVRGLCALTALASSLLLVGAVSLKARGAKLFQHLALLSHGICFSFYCYVRWRAVKVVHDPHKSILAVDWSMLAILVALSMRSAGVSEWICSCWLKKFVSVSLAFMYFNAAISKLQATGLVWFSGEIMRQLIRDWRWTSAWPWLSDLITNRPSMGLLLGVATFVWEFLLSFVLLVWEMLFSFLPGRSSASWQKGHAHFRLMWALVSVAMHLGIYLLMFPPFTTFVHVLVVLVVDPFAFVPLAEGARVAPDSSAWREGDHNAPHSESCKLNDMEGLRQYCLHDLADETRCRAAQNQHHMPSRTLPFLLGRIVGDPARASSKEVDHNAADHFESKERLSYHSQIGIWASTVLLLFCVFCWSYVGITYTNNDHHPFLPFSSFSMFSTYKSAALRHPGPWDRS